MRARPASHRATAMLHAVLVAATLQFVWLAATSIRQDGRTTPLHSVTSAPGATNGPCVQKMKAARADAATDRAVVRAQTVHSLDLAAPAP